jgi:mono/diheme cytochrome c family protein
MMKAAGAIAAGIALLGGAYLAFGPGAADAGRMTLRADDPGTVALGSEVYAANCAACHGVDLEGQPDWRSPGPEGRLPAPPHDATGHTWHHDDDTLFRLTKYGVGSMIGDPDYASDMPIYEGILTDEEIVAALSYIKSTWPQEIRDAHDAMRSR